MRLIMDNIFMVESLFERGTNVTFFCHGNALGTQDIKNQVRFYKLYLKYWLRSPGGSDWYSLQQQVGFESIINIRPRANNRSMEIQESRLRNRIDQIVTSLLGDVQWQEIGTY